MSGKGDTRRPTVVSQAEVGANWDRIFKPKEPPPPPPEERN